MASTSCDTSLTRFFRFTGAMLLAVTALHPSLSTANDPAVSGFQPTLVVYKNAKVVTAPGQVLDKAHLLIKNGRVSAIGTDVPIPTDAEIIDTEGLTIFPGFIDAGASIFLQDAKPQAVEGRAIEISKYALAGMRQDDRNGLTPEFIAGEHLNPRAEDQERYRQSGFVAVHVLPHGRIASGRGTVLNLAALPLRESVLLPASFATLQLSERGGGDYPSTNMGVHAHLRQAFLDAQRHATQQRLFADNIPNIPRPAADAALDALTAMRTPEIKTVFVATSRDDHDRALNFAAEHQLRPVIWGGHEAYRVAERLKKADADVIAHVDFGDEPKVEAAKPGDDPYADLPEPQQVREHKQKEWKQRVSGLAELHKAGIRFALSSRDGRAPADLLKGLRQAIANGLDRDAALASLTTQAAAILGVERDLGTIAVGRPAYFVVMTGPFESESSKVRYIVINGQRYEYHKDAKPVAPPTPGEPAPIQVGGTWTVEIDSSEGKLKGELELTQGDRALSGRFQSEQGDGRLTSGKASAGGIEFIVAIGAGENAVQLKFDAKLDGAVLRGNLKSPFGAATQWTAQRLEPKPQPNATIQLGQIESVDEPRSGGSADALAPSNSGTSPTPRTEPPVEFPEDRRARPIQTGGNVLIKGGTVLTATGKTLPGTSLLVKNGTITAIGPDLQPEPGMLVIDAANRYVMPGIIDTHSHIMISTGLGGVNEATASIVCEVRVRDVVNSADASEYRALAGGVTTARLLHGSANCIGGQDAVVQLKHGTSANDHLFPGAHTGVKFALGENVKFRNGRFPNTRLGVEATLNRAFLEALDYRRQWQEYERARQQAGADADKLLPPRRDLRLEALVGILNSEKFIHSHCYRADEILMLLRVAENHGIRVWSLQHVLEGYKVAPEIVKHGASCSTFADWWAYKVEAFDAIPHNAALLHEAGANAVIKSDDWELIRHLYLEAAKTVRYGNMPPDVALQTITLNPAKELGLADRLGSIEIGKQADLAIFSGHPLNAYSRCEQTIIAGEVYFTREKQPSAMSPSAAAASAKPADLNLPKPEERISSLDLSPANSGRYAIVGATIHPVDADDIPNGVVLVDAGKITGIGPNTLAIPEGFAVFTATGLHLYPGLIDAGTSVGLIEIAKVRETSDLSEIGQFQADLRAGIAVNPDSELIPVARAGGITATLCLPAGGGNMTSHGRVHGAIIPGQTSLVQFAGWTMPEMVFNMEAGLHLLWPSGKDRKQPTEDLKKHLAAARLYDAARTNEAEARKVDPQAPALLIDPRYEALRPYLRGERPVYVEAESKQEILEALHFARQEKLKIVLCGAIDAWKVADQIKAAEVPVIIGPVMRKPLEEYDPFDAPYANAGRLHEAGVKFCFRSDTASNSRNAPFEAAMSVAYGLPEAVALRSVTLTSAEILGAADRLGSLTTGKWANAIITDGSPLQETTQIKGILIQGQPFAPESRQTRFYDKYRARLKK
ncbi:MAG: amidohydrolase family protein [Planctomycetes bacterium]|nr:amidohydrolase family protein [Planctomycetota bacterium]